MLEQIWRKGRARICLEVDPNPSPFASLRLSMLFLRAGKVEKQPLWSGNLQRDTKHRLSMETKSVSMAITLLLPASRALGTS